VVNTKYLLLTIHNTYFVEFLCNQLILSSSIDQAMIFDDNHTAQKFKTMLWQVCNLETSVNTFIDSEIIQ